MNSRTFAFIIACAAASPAHAQATFEGIGIAPGYTGSKLRAISADGAVATGSLLLPEYPFEWRAFRWTTSGGIQPLDQPANVDFTAGLGISPDGSVIVGHSFIGEPVFNGVPARWVNGGAQDRFLGDDIQSTDASFASTDGLIVGGRVFMGNGDGSYRYDTVTQEFTLLDTYSSSLRTNAYAISADGGRIVGAAPWQNQAGGNRAAFWETPSELPVLVGDIDGNTSSALGISADGSIIVGFSNRTAFRWTASGGIEALPSVGFEYMRAESVSSDGSVIAGTRAATSNGITTPVAWRDGAVTDLAEYLASQGADLTGWTLVSALVTPDGRTFAGTGTNPSGETEGWIATLGTPCPADFDGDGFVTGADYDAYVQAFEAGDMSSDFDGDGFITGTDFDLYVAAFEKGC